MIDHELLDETQQALFNLPCGVVVASTSAEGEIQQVNAEFTAITGYTREDIPTVRDWVQRAYPDPEYRAMVMGNWERDVSNPGLDVFYRVRCADGSDKELLLRAGRLGNSRMVVALLDLSEFHLAQRDLRESEDRFRMIAHTVDQVFWIVGLDPERMEYVSPAFESIWGLPAEDLYKDPTQWFAPILDEDHPAVKTAWDKAVAGEADSVRFEYRIRRPDGKLRWIEDSGFAVRDGGGRVVRMVGVAKDVTLRKEAEEARHALEQRMFLAQKMESLGVLAGGVAHDFNNLLLVVLGNAELALLDLSPESPVREKLGSIRRAARSAADLAGQMLAYSGRSEFVLSDLDLQQLVEEFTDLLEAMVSKKAEMKFGTDEPVYTIKGDVTQIRQVVLNLVANASDALDQAGGEITITTGSLMCDAVYLSVPHLDQEREPGLYSYVQVSDTGSGMDEETRTRIFDPFFTTKFTGRGLGMASALGIVNGHRGLIKVSSEPGRGTTIRVLFPVAEGAPEDPEAGPDEVAPPDSNEETILVVDDEEMVRAVVTEMLQKCGYRVLTASDGRTAVSLYEEKHSEIDLVLLDLAMPLMDGRETHRALREFDPDVRVLLCSGYSEQDAEPRSPDEVSTAFVQKPYSISVLMEAVRSALGGPAEGD